LNMIQKRQYAMSIY